MAVTCTLFRQGREELKSVISFFSTAASSSFYSFSSSLIPPEPSLSKTLYEIKRCLTMFKQCQQCSNHQIDRNVQGDSDLVQLLAMIHTARINSAGIDYLSINPSIFCIYYRFRLTEHKFWTMVDPPFLANHHHINSFTNLRLKGMATITTHLSSLDHSGHPQLPVCARRQGGQAEDAHHGQVNTFRLQVTSVHSHHNHWRTN